MALLSPDHRPFRAHENGVTKASPKGVYTGLSHLITPKRVHWIVCLARELVNWLAWGSVTGLETTGFKCVSTFHSHRWPRRAASTSIASALPIALPRSRVALAGAQVNARHGQINDAASWCGQRVVPLCCPLLDEPRVQRKRTTSRK